MCAFPFAEAEDALCQGDVYVCTPCGTLVMRAQDWRRREVFGYTSLRTSRLSGASREMRTGKVRLVHAGMYALDAYPGSGANTSRKDEGANTSRKTKARIRNVRRRRKEEHDDVPGATYPDFCR